MNRRNFLRAGALWVLVTGILTAQTVIMRRRPAAGLGGGGGLAVVAQMGEASSTGDGFTTSAAFNSTGATCMVLAVNSYSSGTDPVVTDSAGNTVGSPVYSPATAATQRWQIYRYAITSTSASHSFSLSGTGNIPTIYAYALSGGSCSLLTGSGVTGSGSNITSIALPSETIGSASIAIGVVGTNIGQPSGYTATGYTIPGSTNGHNQLAPGVKFDTATAYLLTSSTTTLTWDWNLLSNSIADGIAAMVVIQ